MVEGETETNHRVPYTSTPLRDMAKTAKTTAYAVSHPYRVMALTARQNVASMTTALKMCMISHISAMLAYLPQRTMETPDADIRIEVVGFGKDGRWGNHGEARLKAVYMEDSALMLAQAQTGAESDSVAVPADTQDISTLETIFAEVADYMAMRYDMCHLKD